MSEMSKPSDAKELSLDDWRAWNTAARAVLPDKEASHTPEWSPTVSDVLREHRMGHQDVANVLNNRLREGFLHPSDGPDADGRYQFYAIEPATWNGLAMTVSVSAAHATPLRVEEVTFEGPRRGAWYTSVALRLPNWVIVLAPAVVAAAITAPVLGGWCVLPAVVVRFYLWLAWRNLHALIGWLIMGAVAVSALSGVHDSLAEAGAPPLVPAGTPGVVLLALLAISAVAALSAKVLRRAIW